MTLTFHHLRVVGNQEGVMDSLMEALKTGSAFSRDQKRKRAARWKIAFLDKHRFTIFFPDLLGLRGELS